MTLILRAALAYFGIVFGVGFLLGLLRVPLLVPRIGERWAELIEMPFMLITIVLSARWIVGKFGFQGRCGTAFLTGTSAAAVLLLVEFGVVFIVRGITPAEFITGRDPVSGMFYYLMIFVFAAMPALMSGSRGD